MPIDKILMQIKEDHHLKWPNLLQSSPNIWDKRKYCRFHKDHDHYNEDCRDVNEQIKVLIHKGKLQKIMKKGESSRSRDNHKEKPEPNPKDEESLHNHPQSAITKKKRISLEDHPLADPLDPSEITAETGK